MGVPINHRRTFAEVMLGVLAEKMHRLCQFLRRSWTERRYAGGPTGWRWTLNYKISKILTVVIAIAMVFIVPAQAGPKGKKLIFNGSLGTFTAVPSRGSSSKKKKSKKSYRKKSNGSSAARKRKAKAAAIRKSKIRAARKKAKLAAIRKAKKEAAAKRARALAKKGRALAARDSNDISDEEKSTKSVADDDVVEDDVEISERIDVDTRVEASLDESGDLIEESEQSDGRVTCKKFIPSAGLTITVPCSDP